MCCGTGVFDVAPDPPGDEEHRCDADEEIETVKPGLQRVVFVPLLPEFLPDVRQTQAPRQRPGKRVDHEAREIHSRHTRWKRNERSNRRQQATHKDNHFSILRKPAISDVEIVTRKQNVFSVLLNERAAAVHPNPVSH